MKNRFGRSLGLVAAVMLVAPAMSAAGQPDAAAVKRTLAHLSKNPAAWGLSNPGHELGARSSHRDERGVVHTRFGQRYQGIPVFEGEAISHVDARGRVTMTSALREIRGLLVRPNLSSQDAVALAVAEARPAGSYQVVKSALEVLPKGDRSAADRLVWHVSVMVENGFEDPAQYETFWDAHDGVLAFSYNALETGKPGGGGGGGGTAATGTGRTMFVGNQPIGVSVASGVYTMKDPTRSNNYTCDFGNRSGGKTCSQFTDSDGIFGNNSKDNTDRATAAADAHYGLQATWDYYKTAFGRNGIDGAGRTSYSRVHYGQSYQNAFWSNSCFCMTYGDGGSVLYPLVSIDVAGHEMSHGVMSTEAALTYSGESGGLNESNSDIFGTMVEYAVNSSQDAPDYLIGEMIYRSNWSGGNFTPSTALRYMNDPSRDGRSPACWSGSLGSLDVHYSSGPNNHMFYLLAEGGTSKCNGSAVSGIGRDKAARIWYTAIRDYMTSSTNYAGARAAALNAASSIYGSASPERAAVAAAYSAINVN